MMRASMSAPIAALDYGRVMEIVGEVSAAGFRKVALVSDSRPEKRASVTETQPD